MRTRGRWTGRLAPGWVAVALAAGVWLFAAGAVASGAAERAPAAEAPQPVVRSVVVTGNTHVDSDRILSAITHTQPGKPLSREAVQADLKQILDLGYFQSVSVDVQELLEGNPQGSRPPAVRVIFRVVENPVLKQVRLRPDAALAKVLQQQSIALGDAAALLPGLAMGQVAHAPTISRELQELTGRIWQRYGVLAAPGQVDLEADGTLLVELTGLRLGEVLIEGNAKTKDYVIRRELTVKPGDILVRPELEKSLRRVLMLRFFDEVNADLRPGGSGEQVNLVVKVAERRTGLVQLGVSYGGGTGLAGLVEVSDINFLGRGQSVGLSVNYGLQDQRYQLSFTEPYLDSNRTSLGFKLGYQRTKQSSPDAAPPEYWDIRYGGEVTVGRPLSEYTTGYLTFTNNVWAPQDLNGQPLDKPGDVQSGVLRSITLASVTDTSDHPFNPTRGDRLRLSAEFAGLGGSFTFNKFETTYSHYVPVRWGSSTHVLAGRVSAGSIVGDVPDQVRFRLGGSESLRGYGYGQFVGDTMMFANLEYRFPLVRPLFGVVFLDAGNAWRKGDPIDFGQLKLDAGVGIRIDVPPLGMIRLDYGMTRESSPQFHFSIGQAF